MTNIVIKPDSRQEDGKWIPDGIVIFPGDEGSHTERREFFDNPKFDTKEEANKYFNEACRKKIYK